MFENYLGDNTMKVYQGMHFATPETDRTVQEILQVLKEYIVWIVNETYERFAFHQRRQKERKAFYSFYNDLRGLSKTHNFCVRCGDSQLRNQIVEGISNQNSKWDLLKLQNLTL